jgi:hypothetical protein
LWKEAGEEEGARRKEHKRKEHRGREGGSSVCGACFLAHPLLSRLLSVLAYIFVFVSI